VAVPLRPAEVLGVPAFATRVRGIVAREALPLVVLALYAAAAARFLPYELLQDGWLTLVAGRDVFDAGLPATDTLTLWAAGREWVDQQWLAQLAFYGLAAGGGLKLALLGHLAVLVGTMAATLAAARRLGATAPSVAFVGIPLAFIAPWTLQLRAQTLALPLFVATMWLLARDSRAADRRVYLVLPLLVLWANVHGTVLVGVALVVLRGVLRRSPLLVLAPVACIFVSPYALDLPGYYRTMLLEPTLRAFVVEWQPSTPSATTAIFYAAAFATVWLLARNRRALTRFEAIALVLLLAGSLPAIRSIAWFGLAGAMLLPRLVDTELRRFDAPPPPIALPVGIAASVVIAVALLGAATRPAEWFTTSWRSDAAEQAARGQRVLADERFANWLLWERPDLRGRIAFDARFELLDRPQYERLIDFYSRIGPDWDRAARGYDTVVLNARRRELVAALAQRGYERVVADERVVVLRRSR
jgi:hypothetical protein